MYQGKNAKVHVEKIKRSMTKDIFQNLEKALIEIIGSDKNVLDFKLVEVADSTTLIVIYE